MRAALGIVFLGIMAPAHGQFSVESGDGCPRGKRLATVQEIGLRDRRTICSQMAPDSVRRLAGAGQDTTKWALMGLNAGCDVRPYPGPAPASICVALPPPPPPGQDSACKDPVPAGGRPEAPPDKDGQTRAFIREYEYLDSGQYLVSPNRAFHAIVTADGRLQVNKGPGPLNAYGTLWEAGASANRSAFVVQAIDGNLCLYPGSGPFGGPGQAGAALWCTIQVAASQAAYFTIVRNDGNLCTYQGTGPVDSPDMGRLQIWCSGQASPAMPWREGRRIIAATGVNVGGSLYYGPWPERIKDGYSDLKNRAYLWLRPGTDQHWVFGSDGTVRPADDRSRCLQTDGRGFVSLAKGCSDDRDGKVGGWEYCEADGTLRNRNFPDGCTIPQSGVWYPDVYVGWSERCYADRGQGRQAAGAWTLR
jgi:hypothetical protein